MRKLLLAAAALDAAVATSTHAQTAPSCPSTATLFWICSKPSTTRYAVRALRIGHVCGRFSRRTAALSQFPRDDDWITPSQNAATLSMSTRLYTLSISTAMAHLWSTYEIRETPDGKATVRGISSMQAVSDGSQWRLVEILWQAETPEETIPSKYLP